MPRSFLLFSFLILIAISVSAQKDSTTVTFDSSPIHIRQIDAEDLQKYRNDDAFNYEVVKPESSWWRDFKSWLGNILLRLFESIFGIEKAVGFVAIFIRILPYLLLGILVYMLVKFFLHVNARSLQQLQKDRSLVSLSEEEHIIKSENIQELIRKAVADRDYRLAIRYYYLYLLKVMGEKEIIAWELQKTNDDYLNEIRNSELKQPFTKITRLYDHIWYGGFTIDKVGYQKVERAFSSLQKMIIGNG